MIEIFSTAIDYYFILILFILSVSLVKLIKKGSNSDCDEKEDEFCGIGDDKKSTSSEKATEISLVR